MDPVLNRPLGVSATALAGLEMRRWLHVSGRSEADCAEVAARNREHARNNPRASYADAHDPTPLFDPLTREQAAEPADGCVVLVLAGEEKAPADAVFIDGVGWSQDAPSVESRDWDRAAAARAGRPGRVRPRGDRLRRTSRSQRSTTRYAYKQLQHLDALGLAGPRPRSRQPERRRARRGPPPGGERPRTRPRVHRTAPRGRRPCRRGPILARGPLDLRGRRGDAPMSPRVAVVGAGMTKFVRRAQETGKELSSIATREALGFVRVEARRRRRRLPDQRAGRVRRRPSQGRLPGRRRRRVGEAVHPHLRRRRQRRLHRDPGLVHGRLRHGRRRRVRRRGEDVLLPAASAGRLPHDLRQHPRAASRPEPALDLRAGDAAVHAGVRARQARHRAGRGEEQAQRGGPPGRPPRPDGHHRRGRPRERDARLARAAARRLADLRRRGRHRDGVGGRCEEAHRSPRVGAGRRLEPRHHVLDESRPRLPGVRRERSADGLRDGRRERAAEGDPRRRALRPLRLQGAPPPRGTAAVRPGEGARGRGATASPPATETSRAARPAGCSASATRSRPRA